jgi:hypothetical protein
VPRRNITLSEEMDRALKKRSQETGVPISALIRKAIEEWAQRSGIEIEDTVSWGGYRNPPDESQSSGSQVAVALSA